MFIYKLSFKHEGIIKILCYTRSQKRCYIKTFIENNEYLKNSSQQDNQLGAMARYIWSKGDQISS